MQRVTEPEIMDAAEQVRAYALADFEEPHSQFIALLSDRLSHLPETGHALDLGCGAGDITRRFALAFPGWTIDGIDGSPTMLATARQMTVDNSIDDRVNFIEVLLPAAPPSGSKYDLIISNSLLHHLTDPGVFWASLIEWSGGHADAFVMDLKRPESPEQARNLVQQYSAGEPDILQTDFFNSLLAAFEPEEIEEQLRQASLTELRCETVTDRHVIVWGSTTS